MLCGAMTEPITRRGALTLGALTGTGIGACSPRREEAPRRTPEAPVALDPGAVRIAFGSCNKPNLDQPLWGPILRTTPSAFAWLGDIAYTKDGDVAALPALYARQAANAGYRELCRATRVVGVRDDHDYGINDGGRSRTPSVIAARHRMTPRRPECR